MVINFKSITAFANKSGLKSILETRNSASKINFGKLEYAAKDSFTKDIGKHKIPRNLYHLTTKENYAAMLEEGILDIGGEKDFIQGVYMFELKNFFKRWTPSTKAMGKQDKRKDLLKYVSNYGDEMVLLKIPTKELEKKNLLVRSVDRTYELLAKKECEEIEKAWQKTGIAPKGEFNHLINGDSAKNSKLYKQRKEAVEYIYPSEIDIEKVEKVGNIKPYADLAFDEISTGENLLLKAFRSAFKGKPEEKALVVLENTIK